MLATLGNARAILFKYFILVDIGLQSGDQSPKS